MIYWIFSAVTWRKIWFYYLILINDKQLLQSATRTVQQPATCTLLQPATCTLPRQMPRNYGFYLIMKIPNHCFLQIDPQIFSYFIFYFFGVVFPEAVSYLRKCSVVSRRIKTTKEKWWNDTGLEEPKHLEINLSIMACSPWIIHELLWNWT
jgi:hypothetical protein